jgi:hypothetical protein
MDLTLKLQPRLSPEPGRPFVNREHELQLVQEKLDTSLHGNPMRLGVVCFWGAFGMGKSWLLRELERRCKYTVPRSQGSHPTIAARLDLNKAILPALWTSGQFDQVQLIRELWRQLADQVAGAVVPDLERASPNVWAEEFVKQVTVWSTRSATPVILLDTVDDLATQDEKTFFWLEEHLVERLALTDRVLFVFASRGELQRWKRFQVRRRIDSHRLMAFDTGAAGQQVKASLDVSQVLYRHACGHPLVTDYLGTTLESQQADLQVMDSVEQILKPPLVQPVLHEVITEILRSVPDLPARLARYACVLRWVSVEPLRFLAEELKLVEAGRGDAYYLDQIIGVLQSNHLLYWNSDKNCYEFDLVLRHLLTNFLELDEPEGFCRANLAAFEFHRAHLEKSPQYLGRYLPELAYHRAILARVSPETPLPTWSAWWSQFLDKALPLHPEPWAELARALEQDKELQDTCTAEYGDLYSEAQKRAANTTAQTKED